MDLIYYGVVAFLVLSASTFYTLRIEEQHLTWKGGLLLLGLTILWPLMMLSLVSILGGGLFLYVCDKWQPSKGRVIIHSRKRAAREMADRMLQEGDEPKVDYHSVGLVPPAPVILGSPTNNYP
jgi:hypothetical protein